MARALYSTPDGHYRTSAVGTYLCEQDLNHIEVATDGNGSGLLTFEIPEHPRNMNIVDDLKGVLFIIHDARWNILKRYSYNTPIPLYQLADVLSDTRGRFFQNVSIEEMDLEDPTKSIKIRSNILSLLGDVQEPSRAVEQREKQSNGDTFKDLPLEIREMIAVQLSMEDFYRLRFVSRVMGDILFGNVP